MPQLMFLGLGLLAFVRYLQTWRRRALVLVGVALGLSCAVKFSSGPAVGACVLSTLLLGDHPWRKRTARAVGLGALAVAVFVAVNPYLYPAPLRLVRETVAGWNSSKHAQQQDPILARSAVTTPQRGIERVARGAVFAPHDTPVFSVRAFDRAARGINATLVALIVMFMWWRARNSGLVPRPRREWLLLGALLITTLAGELAVRGAPLNLYGLLVGMAVFHVIAGSPDARPSRVFLGLSIVTMFLGTALWLPFDWPRYYLPLLVVLAPGQAAGAAELGRMLQPARSTS